MDLDRGLDVMALVPIGRDLQLHPSKGTQAVPPGTIDLRKVPGGELPFLLTPLAVRRGHESLDDLGLMIGLLPLLRMLGSSGREGTPGTWLPRGVRLGTLLLEGLKEEARGDGIVGE